MLTLLPLLALVHAEPPLLPGPGAPPPQTLAPTGGPGLPPGPEGVVTHEPSEPGGLGSPRTAVVRATVGTANSVLVTVSDELGNVFPGAMKDDGRPPDFKAHDGDFAVELPIIGNTATAILSVDGVSLTAAPTTWSSADERRVLKLTLANGGLTAEAVIGGDAPNPPDQGLAPPSSGSTDRWALGVALLALVVAMIGLWPRRPLDLSALRVGGAGLFGAGTPSLSAPAQVWTVAEPDRSALIERLLERLAGLHPVLIVAPEGEFVPAALGEAVFRTTGARSAAAKPAAQLTSQARPLVVLVVPPTGENYGAWRNPLPGCRTIIIVAADEAATARFARDQGRWTCQFGGADVALPSS